jgi:hypothetical protein
MHFGRAVSRKDKEIADLTIVFASASDLVELADRFFLAGRKLYLV